MSQDKIFLEIEKIVVDYGLKPATRREMPLFTISCIAHSYTTLLSRHVGMSYQSLGAIGGNGWFHSMLNEEKIAEDTAKLVESQKEALDQSVFKPTLEIFNNFRQQFTNLKPLLEKDPLLFLEKFVPLYPQYALSIGVYNCFWRYFGNTTDKMPKDKIEQIGKERDQIARLYLETESVLKSATKKIGELRKFDGDLLRYLTWPEMNDYLGNKLEIASMLKELESRRGSYFYLFIRQPLTEKVFTDLDLVSKIKSEFYEVKGEVTELRGFSAFPGFIRGQVFNLLGQNNRSNLDLTDKVLVTSMTHPDDLPFIKQSSAIITDEGGILSHAAITARELKKPCVIGTRIATKVLKDGMTVEVDANNGVIKIKQ